MAYSFRVAFENYAFLQRDLMTHQQFAREAQKRGSAIPTADPTAAEALEELDREGSLRPIAFLAGPYNQTAYQRILGRPDLVFREEVPFREWDSYRWTNHPEDPRRTQLTALYSPWQLIFLHRAEKFRSLRVHAAGLVDDAQRARLIDNAQQTARAMLDAVGQHDDEWRRLLLLLVRIQNRYWPFVGSYTLDRDPRTHEYFDPVPRERRRFSARGAIAELELTADDVREYHRRLSFFAQQEDPVPEWWILRRMATRWQRERMRGSARIVDDIWDATQMLRILYRQLTRRTLPDVPFVGQDPRWQERVLGHEPRLYYDQLDLLRFLERNQLYPHQVHVFVEGESENVLLPMLLEHWLGPLEARGIRFTNLAGIDNLARRHQELVRGFSTYARTAVLIADNESEIARYVATLTEQQLINAEGVWLWDKNLEEDNFTDADLVRAVKEIAVGRRARVRGLSGRMVRASFEARRGIPKASATFLAELIRLAAHPDHGSVRVSKPEIARKLGEHLLTELEAVEFDALAERRPILRRTQMIMQLAEGAQFAGDRDDG
jgi:hypothetical protein